MPRPLNEELVMRVYRYIRDCQREEGESPSQRTIAANLNMDHRKTHDYVHRLAARGYIELTADNQIAMPPHLAPKKQMRVPLLGEVKCGEPTTAYEDFEGMYQLSEEFVGKGKHFMLMAKGDSMIDAGIEAGDYLVIREQPTAESGDIVVACKGEFCDEEEATLKRYKILSDGSRILRAENGSGKYKDMDAGGFRIIGKLVSFIRKVDGGEG